MEVNDAKSIGVDELLRRLKSSAEGLSEQEAQIRLEENGYNEIKEKKPNTMLKFLKRFYGPVPLLLWIVVVISYFLHNFRNFYIVIGLLLFNAIAGFAEEYKADKSVALLKQKLSTDSRVRRSGRWIKISSRLVVPGDVIRLRLGDIVPADCKVIESESLEADESAITGESLPVSKNEGEVAYSGSVIKRGEATVLVFATASNTLYGKTAEIVSSARSASHLEGVVLNITKYLILADIIIISIMFFYGISNLRIDLGDLLSLMLVIFIASVPVALPAAFTVSMALGTEKLVKKNVLVTKLSSIEETSTMNILCIDKTGTLTTNRITVKKIRPFNTGEEEILKYAAEASRASDNDPIDNAILDFAASRSVKTGDQLTFSPFDPSTKRTEAVITDKREKYSVMKGASKVISGLFNLDKTTRSWIEGTTEELSKEGFRSILVAMSKEGQTLFGILALYDEPRADAKLLIKELGDLGVRSKMLTGDNVSVAKEIAGEVGLGTNIIDSESLKKMSSSDLASKIENVDGFANIYPEDKYMIVKALQKLKYHVGMTGDGVNDAPSLKQAEVGIAVSNATDVAKSSADLVLTADGIGVIVEAVKESRRIFERIVTYSLVKVAKVFQIIGFIAIAFIFMDLIPISSFLLILLLFTNDITSISLSTDTSVYSKKPDVWNIKSIVYSSCILGVMLLAESLIFIPINLSIFGMSLQQFQTSIFLLFNVTDQLLIFTMRERASFWKSRPSNVLMLASLFSVSLGAAFSYFGIFMAPISIAAIATTFSISIIFMLFNNFVKIRVFNVFKIS